MNVKEERETFEKYEERFGNPYKAVLCIGKEARQYSESHNNVPLDSESLTFVLQNKDPEIVQSALASRIAKQTHKRSNIDEVRDIYLSIDDPQIKKAVKLSVDQSMDSNHLIYIYNETEDENYRSKIRILTRMIVSRLQDKGEV